MPSKILGDALFDYRPYFLKKYFIKCSEIKRPLSKKELKECFP